MTISAQAAAASFSKLEEEFKNGSITKQAVIKAASGLSLIIASSLDRSVKIDAMLSAIEMLASAARCDALVTMHNCHHDTQAPLDLILGAMGSQSSESVEKHERRFVTMMQLFVDEAEKRGGG